MKKLVTGIILLVVLLLVLLPGAVGLLAENQFRRLSTDLDSENPGLTLIVEDYQRGWFSSRAQYRLRPSYPGLELYLRKDVEKFAGLPSIILEAEIMHGPIPFAALGRHGASRVPVIAQSFDRVSVAFGDGALINLPAQVTTRLGFSGNYSNDIEVAPFAYEFDDPEDPGELTWGGMNLETRFDSDLDKVSLDGQVGAIDISSSAFHFRAGPVQLDSRQKRSDYGLWIGDVRVLWKGMRIEAADNFLALGEMAVESQSNISAGMFDQAVMASLSEISVAGWKGGPGKLNLVLEKMDASAVGHLTAVIGRLAFTNNESVAAEIMPLIFPQLQALLAGGPHLALRELSLHTPDGTVMLMADLALPESAPEAAFGFILGLQGNAQVRFPAKLMDDLMKANPENGARIQLLMDTGFLLRNEEGFLMDAAVKGGLLTVNGQPIPLPFGF